MASKLKKTTHYHTKSDHISQSGKMVEQIFTDSDLFCLKALLDGLRKRTKPDGILRFVVVDLLTKCEAALAKGQQLSNKNKELCVRQKGAAQYTIESEENNGTR